MSRHPIIQFAASRMDLDELNDKYREAARGVGIAQDGRFEIVSEPLPAGHSGEPLTLATVAIIAGSDVAIRAIAAFWLARAPKPSMIREHVRFTRPDGTVIEYTIEHKTSEPRESLVAALAAPIDTSGLS